MSHPRNVADDPSLRRFMLREEYRAERNISIARAVIYVIAYLEVAFVGWGFQDQMAQEFRPVALITAILTIILMLDMLFLAERRFAKFYNVIIKYIVVTIDALLAIVLITAFLGSDYRHEEDVFTGPMLFTGTSAVLICLNLFRNSVWACIYTGALMLAGFFVAILWSGVEPDLASIFVKNGEYQFQNVTFIWPIIMITTITAIVSARSRGLLMKSARQEQLQRFLPETVAREVMAGQRELAPGGRRENVTILFSDIRGFTSMSEVMEPEEVIDFLNTYFNDMIEIVFRYNGALDKIMGDGLMAIFAAEFTGGSAADAAVKSAIDMQRKLSSFNELRRFSGSAEVNMGVGIHSGDVIMGNVGSARRMDFTAIGDAVNTASRLESLTREYGSGILISGETRELLRDSFHVSQVASVQLKGKARTCDVYKVEYAGEALVAAAS